MLFFLLMTHSLFPYVASMFEKTQENKMIEKDPPIKSAEITLELGTSSANCSPTSNPSMSSKDASNSPLSTAPILPQVLIQSSNDRSGYTKKSLKRRFPPRNPICQHTCRCKMIRVVRKIKVKDSFTQTDSP